MKDSAKLFKYSTEAQLNIFSEESLFFSLEGLDILEEESYLDNFHVYAILARPRYIFEKSSFKITNSGINFTILDDKGDFYCTIPDFKFRIVFHGVELDDFDYNFLSLSCQPPFNQFSFKLSPREDLIKYLITKVGSLESEEYIRKDILEFELTYDVEDILTLIFDKYNKMYEMEVLYIGQAQGREANRGAIERLQSHETLQKILIDCHTKFINKRLFIMLFKFTEQQIMLLNGFDKSFLSNKEDDVQHHKKLVDDAIDIALNVNNDRLRQVINITEAAMINYFKPYYNDKFVDNFPSQKHQSYTHYYSLEYNSVSVELGLESRPQIVLFTKENRIQSVWDFIQYDMFAKDRASIYDIFKNTNLPV